MKDVTPQALTPAVHGARLPRAPSLRRPDGYLAAIVVLWQRSTTQYGIGVPPSNHGPRVMQKRACPLPLIPLICSPDPALIRPPPSGTTDRKSRSNRLPEFVLRGSREGYQLAASRLSQPARERRHPRSGCPSPAFLDPRRNRGLVGACLAAQPRGLPGERLVKLSLGRALEDPGNLGQQVGPAAGQLAERGHRGCFLVFGELPPLRAAAGLAPDLSDEDTVGFRALIDHVF